MRSLLLLALFSLGCEADSTTGDSSSTQRLEWQSELDTQRGLYHLILSSDPDPAIVGEFALTMTMSLNSPNPCFDGAALLNANVSVNGRRPEEGGVLGGSVGAEEQGGGVYRATWSFAQPGYWELEIEVGAAEDTDIAVIGLIVED